MLTFERVLGFFLMGTALYLLSILPASMQVPALAVLLVAAAAAWVWGRWGSLRGTLLRRLLIGAGGLAAVGFSMYLSFAPAAPWRDVAAFPAGYVSLHAGKKAVAGGIYRGLVPHLQGVGTHYAYGGQPEILCGADTM